MTLPPYASTLGITMDGDGAGAPVLAMPFGSDVLGRPGFLHGGAIAGLLEIAARAALDHALAAAGATLPLPIITPVTITTDFRRGGQDRPTRATGTVIRLGTRIATVEAIVWQDDRARPIAGAQATYLLTRR